METPDAAATTPAATALGSWASVCVVVGGGLACSALVIGARGRLPAWALGELRNATFAGAVLALTGVIAFLARRGALVGRLAPDRDAPRAASDSRWLALFLISFVSLFVELALIRYAGSQVRVFSFYRNVPLIGAFLGLGLGCWQGRGGGRQALSFLAWLVPLLVLLSASPAVLGAEFGASVATGSSEHVLGDVAVDTVTLGSQVRGQVLMVAVCVLTLVAVMLLFVEVGRLLGAAFDGLPRLGAYSVNIIGSLLGVVGFTALGYAEAPPWVWFTVGLAPLLYWLRPPGARLLACVLVALNALAVWPSAGDTVWSPYQKLVGHVVPPPPAHPDLPPGYLVQISDVFYQLALDLRPETVARVGNRYPNYDRIYQAVPRPGRVLIVGSGTGNDVAAALRAGAVRVDAVDIDPAIVRMGRAHHPERPYDDPRVRVIVEDARAVLRRAPAGSYDLVVFGLLDSHTQLGQSSLRLDNYVFTRESFESARAVTAPGGYVVVTAAAFRPWFVERLWSLVAGTVNAEVLVERSGLWWTFIAKVDPASPPRGGGAVGVPTDDWPFLYLRARAIPGAYALAVLALAVVSAGLLRAGGVPLAKPGWGAAHLFFLGAGFLLMEVHAVNRLALLFGTTWLVSAVTIALVLFLILAANLTLMRFPQVGDRLVLGGLLLSLAAGFTLQPGSVVGGGLALATLYGCMLLSPVYFAGILFARAFRQAPEPGEALGANLLGAVLGGWSEYASMAYGMRVLVLLAGLYYLFAAVARFGAARAGEAAPAAQRTSAP